ncbi:transcriptional regulator with XRE-family HTH domain [Bacillus niacini]|uniref:Transcriptional regulator with XRE-family HTH domain n=1 Tax=Neobacillus niacini TaxID=86668 RepID=A0A852TGG8_9BACI|nr:helix-turn-helix transcriptional regulator [Neobacillus niacini]NYE07301.1 transcriptional regulator with XRE-family HTH domain [Neobacillus niacini]
MNREVLRFIRVSRKLSVRKFAERLGVSHALISAIEGDRRLTENVQKKVVETFGLTDEKLVSIKLLINEIKN